MVEDLADGVVAAGAGAGVVALVVSPTSQGSVAVRVDNALRSAAGVRVSEVLPSAGTLATAALHCWVSVRTTGVGVAGVPRWWRCWGGQKSERDQNR